MCIAGFLGLMHAHVHTLGGFFRLRYIDTRQVRYRRAIRNLCNRPQCQLRMTLRQARRQFAAMRVAYIHDSCFQVRPVKQLFFGFGIGCHIAVVIQMVLGQVGPDSGLNMHAV